MLRLHGSSTPTTCCTARCSCCAARIRSRKTRMSGAIFFTAPCALACKPRSDAALYVIFFFPGIAALIYAGYDYAAISWRIAEHSNVTANGPPVYQFKMVIPIAGALVMLQGIAEMVRCVVCLRTGEWPSRLHDVAEIDVVEEQLADSEYVDEESRKIAIARAHEIDETARQRGMGGGLEQWTIRCSAAR